MKKNFSRRYFLKATAAIATAAMLPSINLSFGIAAYPEHGLDTADLIRVADKALYKAKDEGRDRVVIG